MLIFQLRRLLCSTQDVNTGGFADLDSTGPGQYYVDENGVLYVYLDGKLLGTFKKKKYASMTKQDLEQEVEDIIDSFLF